MLIRKAWALLWLPLILMAFGVAIVLTFVAVGPCEARYRLSKLFNL